MTEKKYPEEIYPRPSDYNGQKIMSITPKDLELAYDQGYRHGQLEVRRDGLDPVDTWTRLTTSNPDWGRIDWSALYERPVLLRHVPSFSNFCTKIISKGPYTVGYDEGPHSKVPADQALLLKTLPTMPYSSLYDATQAALEDRDGWALYVLGELPLSKRTADQLEPGTCLRGHHYEHNHDEGELMTVVVTDKGKFISYLVPADLTPANEVEVIEEYGLGTFSKPKENR